MPSRRQIAAHKNRRGKRQRNPRWLHHQPGGHRGIRDNHQQDRRQNKRQEEVRVHHQRNAENHRLADVKQRSRRGNFPQLFHLLATAAQQHKNHQPQQRSGTAGRNPQVIKLLGDDMRDRQPILKRFQVFRHIRQPDRANKHQHNGVAVQPQGPQDTNQDHRDNHARQRTADVRHGNTDKGGNHAIDIAERRSFNDQAQRQHHGQHAEAGDQGEKRFRHRGRYALRHADHQITAGHQAVDLRGKQRNHNRHKQSLAANHPHRQHAFDKLRCRTVCRRKERHLGDRHHKCHQRHRPGAERVQGAIFFRQPVGNAERGEQRHDVIGRFDRVQHLIAPGIAKHAGHHLTVAGNRQVGEYQEKRTNQHKRHIENNAVTYRQDMLLTADFQRGGHDIAFNK